MNQSMLLVLSAGSLFLCFIVHFRFKLKQVPVLKERFQVQCDLFNDLAQRFKVLDEKTIRYSNSLSGKQHKEILDIRDTFQALGQILSYLDALSFMSNLSEVKCILDLLEEGKTSRVHRYFDNDDATNRKLDLLCSWSERLNSQMQNIGEDVLRASQQFNAMQPYRQTRNDTVIDLEAAGIVLSE